MNDSFADLWASSAPIKPTQPPQKLGAAPSASTTRPTQSQPNASPYPYRPQKDAFSILSASQPTSRTQSPQIGNPTQPQPRIAVSSRSSAATSGDAFSGLFSTALGHGNTNVASMTMAERASIAQKAKVPQNGSAGASSSSAMSSAWDGLDSLAQTTATNAALSTKTAPTSQDDFDFAFGDVPSTRPALTPLTGGNDDDWDLSEFSSLASRAQSKSSSSIPISAPVNPASISGPQTLWNLDDFASSSPRPPPSRSQTGTPGDFDFGDREDGLLDDDDSDEGVDTRGRGGAASQADDILGDLSKPVNHSSRVSPSQNQNQTPRLPSRSRTATASPPPHITGQLVEMGFSPQQSKTALLSTMTSDGFNVQAATEWLLANASGSGEGSTSSPRPNQDRDRDRDRDRIRNQGAPRTRNSRPPPSRPDSHQPTSQTQTEVPASAEKLLSQASEIGRGMFNRANALWKEGKERAVKMYEERAATGVSGSGGGNVKDGRPRWMQEGMVHEDEESVKEVTEKRVPKGGFRDDGDDGGQPRPEGRERPRPALPPRRSPQPQSQPEIDLFGSDTAPTVYQSPFRRGKPKSSQTTTTVGSPASVSSSTRTPPTSHASAAPRVFTATIANAPLLSSTTHKSAGTTSYKVGDFTASLTSYTCALEALPDGHVLRVPVLTNLALVKAKLGDLGGVIGDCGEALRLLDSYLADREGGLGNGKVKIIVEDGRGADLPTEIDLIEGFSKAHRRRAEAYEGLEKWELARKDWEVLVDATWTPGAVRGDAVRGVGRCRMIIEGGGSATATSVPSGPTSKSRPQPAKPASQPTVTRSNATVPTNTPALTAFRAATSQTAAEDAARHTYKDAVDARLSSWRTGKETNIRALLTTLDVVLWPELGWKKVGMAEVVGKGQVKIVYVRAIARVHPDKLNVNNTTVEQRMIANGVFGTLNEAWNAFQQQ